MQAKTSCGLAQCSLERSKTLHRPHFGVRERCTGEHLKELFKKTVSASQGLCNASLCSLCSENGYSQVHTSIYLYKYSDSSSTFSEKATRLGELLVESTATWALENTAQGCSGATWAFENAAQACSGATWTLEHAAEACGGALGRSKTLHTL